MSLQQFHSKKIGVVLKADKNRFAVLSFQKLINGNFFGIPRGTTTLPNPISAKELGYWVKEGINRCFLRGHYKIAKSSGISAKYNRRLEMISPQEFPEGAELILPRNRCKASSRTALILYLKNGLLGYYENSFSSVVNRHMFDPYAAWGFLPYNCSNKALGERVHRSLLCLDSSSVPKKERLTGEDYIPESQRVERLFLEEMKLRLGLKTDEELFEGLLCCHPIELQCNYLIAPTRRIGFKNFAIMGKRYVVENVYCTASELGASIREAFRRCESAPLKELPTLINYDENP